MTSTWKIGPDLQLGQLRNKLSGGRFSLYHFLNKLSEDTVSTTEIQRLKEKTMRLRKQLAIANCIIEGKSRKARENPISAEEFEGPESEEDTQMMYSAVATPLPSMSTPKAPQINLNRLLSTRKVLISPVLKQQPGAQAKTANYTAEGEAILFHAMRDFEARIVGQDFFPNWTTCLQWVEKCFRDACATAKAQFISDKHVLKLDCEAWTGYVEHLSIIFLLSYIFDESNMGVVFEKYFNPISLQTLASLFTMIRAAISEWSSGTCNKVKKFSEEEYDKYYKAYLIDLTKWDGMNPAVSLNIRHRMYAKAQIRMREDSLDDPTVHIVGSIEAQLRQEMEARTGETESEREDSEMDDDGNEDDCGGIEA
ncbi:hypothetical protein EV359DRAFT_68231 [Lentinula novae-zelandiae]|nr:hypothetical protein EV359DRAFT_68231 [Lentinula novae-zelandiae]